MLPFSAFPEVQWSDEEPTNHLEIESIQWLENFIKTKANTVVLVSHDKAFIDNVTNRTIEISLGKIYDYAVNYSKFLELRKERVEQQMRAYQNQQKQIQDTEAFIERFRYKATKSAPPRFMTGRAGSRPCCLRTYSAARLRIRG